MSATDVKGCCCGPTRTLEDNLGEAFLQERRPGNVEAAFPDPARIWQEGSYKCLGSGIKYRKIAFFSIQLYTVAFYVEEDAAKSELQRLKKEGYFKDYSEDTICGALLAGPFKKFLQIRLLRSVSFSQFTGEIGRDLKPRLDSSGDDDLWVRFEDFFRDKSLDSGSNLLALTLEDGSMEGGFWPPSVTDFTAVKPGLSFSNAHFSQALLDVYLGSGKVVPEARKAWADAARLLLN